MLKKDLMTNEVPTIEKLIWPTLEALKAMGGSGSNQEILDKVVEMMKLPDEVQNVPYGNGAKTKVNYNLGWARSCLRWYGALENSSRGVWTITPKGQTLTQRDASTISARVKGRFPPRPARTRDRQSVEQPVEEAEDSWRERLQTLLQQMSPDAFQRLAQRILRESGFVNVEVTGRSGDGGIDGIGVLRVKLLSFQVLFQCKRYKGAVSPMEVRDFRGAMVGRTDKGLFITTGRFTADARREATRDGAPPIELVDGEQLCDLLKELKIGVTTQMVENVIVQPDTFKAI